MNIKEKLDLTLSSDRLHLLHLIADVAGSLAFPIYLVGGSVRDIMLGRPIKDFDLTVEGDAGKLAETILKKLGGKIVVHSKFGTARWTLTESTLNRLGVPLFQSENIPPFLDFVSARSETYIKPGELPIVKHSTIEDDLRRRDFTINAMAIRLDGSSFGLLFDPLSGQSDIDNGQIRVLHPNSFLDDPTRMFRAVRYAMRYDFQIEPETRALFNDEAQDVLSQLSGERIRYEFDMIFEEDIPLLALSALSDEFDLVNGIHPALQKADANALSHIKEPSSEFGDFGVPEILTLRQTLGWVLYLDPLSKSEIESVAKRLAFPSSLTQIVQSVIVLDNHMASPENWRPSQWTFFLDDLPPLSVYAKFLVGGKPELHHYLTTWRNIHPFTSGNDLKNRGLVPGPKFKEILTRLRAAWLDGEVENEEDEKRLLGNLIKWY